MPHESPIQLQVPSPPSDALVVDARGLLCPWPLLNCQQAIASLVGGARLAVYADDPLAEIDLRSWCERAGHHIVALEQVAIRGSGKTLYALIEKA